MTMFVLFGLMCVLGGVASLFIASTWEGDKYNRPLYLMYKWAGWYLLFAPIGVALCIVYGA